MADLSGVEETMTEVRRNWNVMLQEQFNPIMVALEMLQGNNPSHDYDSFLRLHKRLDESMALIVEEYYTSFNDAVSIFSGIVDNTKQAHDIVSNVKGNLKDFSDQLKYKRAEIPDTWAKVQKYKDDFAFSGKLEKIQKAHLQALELGERNFFIPASRMLMGAIYDARYLMQTQTVGSAEMLKLLDSSRDGMFEMIVEGIHNLIYLKDTLASDQLLSKLIQKIPESKSLLASSSVSANQKIQATTVNNDENDLVLAPNEFEFKPSSNTVAYLISLVRSAAVLELLPNLLSIISQRIISELHQITERIMTKILKKYRYGDDSTRESPIFPGMYGGSMSKSQRVEFEGFLPTLRKLFDKLLLHYLAVAHNIGMIGEAVAAIVKEGGMEIDVHAFYKNTLSAVHGEVKNFMASILHGNKGNPRVFTNSAVAITEALKGGPDSTSKKDKDSPFLYQFVNLIQDDSDFVVMDSGTVLTFKEKEAARKLASMLAVDPFSTSQQDTSHNSLARPCLQYLSVLYRPFAHFDAWLGIIFPQEQKNTRFVDEAFVESVLSEEFIPNIQSSMLLELSKAFHGPDSLFWHGIFESDLNLAIGKDSNSVLSCVSAFVALYSQVSCVLHQIPGCQQEVEQLLLELLSQFLEKCDTKLRSLTSNSNSATSSIFDSISVTFIGHESLWALISQHSMLTGAEDAEMDSALAEKEILLLEKLKSDRSLHRNEVILDYRVLRSICLLQRSLELLPNMLGDTNFGVVPGFSKFRPETKQDDQNRLSSIYFDGSMRSLIPFSPDFALQYENFLDAVKNMADKCLFLLRVELRVHCFYSLDLAYREGSYEFDEDCMDPDPYVSTLATDLIKYESLVSQYLPYSRYHVVMDELAEGLTGMLISDFRYIRGLNPAGCQKLQRNVSTLEQILALLDTGTNLDRARHFYLLAAYGPDKFIEMATQVPYKYTMQQYQSIFDVYYRDNSGDISIRRTHANQLVRLKYFIEGK